MSATPTLKILVTGATGFVGRALVEILEAGDYHVVATVRDSQSVVPMSVEKHIVGNISAVTAWSTALQGVDVLVHCAARAHIMNDSAVDPLTEFREVNTAGTINLARQAADAGIQRFIFMSSVKVNGEFTEKIPFLPEDNFIPTDPYGLSKYEAEQGLLALAKETGMEVVIIRPTLVYGLGVKGNFASLLKWIKRSVPLPLGFISNKRSLIAVDNLISFIVHCIHHPKAASEIFLISDGEDISTPELLRKVATSLDRKALLLPVPVSLMTVAAGLLGKGDVVRRLCASLQVDSSKARTLLGWEPITTMHQQLKKMAVDDDEKNM